MSQKKEEISYSFIVNWDDTIAQITRKFVLTYWINDSSVSMYDLKHRRTFLKRMPVNNISLKDLYINNVVIIYSRQLKIIDYGNEMTRNKLSLLLTSKCLLIGGNNVFKTFNNILSYTMQNNNKIQCIKSLKSVLLTPMECNQISMITKKKWDSEVSIFVEFGGEHDIKQFLNDNVINITEYNSLCNSIINDYNTSAKLNNCSICLIKPHCLINSGKILNNIISNGFNITSIRSCKLSLNDANKFMEVYRGVIKEYSDLINELISGTIIVIEIYNNETNIVDEFREFCGPRDTIVAKKIRPNSIRGLYGINRIKNGIHCTDLAEDGILESQFFFKILQQY